MSWSPPPTAGADTQQRYTAASSRICEVIASFPVTSSRRIVDAPSWSPCTTGVPHVMSYAWRAIALGWPHARRPSVDVDLYLDQQHLDTTTPTGKLLFHVTGAFSEFERSMIRRRVNPGLNRHQGQDQARRALHQQSGHRPEAPWSARGGARADRTRPAGTRQWSRHRRVARMTGLGTGTVHKPQREMAAQ